MSAFNNSRTVFGIRCLNEPPHQTKTLQIKTGHGGSLGLYGLLGAFAFILNQNYVNEHPIPIGE